MSSQDRSQEDRREAADSRHSKRRSRGRRNKTIEFPEDNQSFEDYVAERVWAFRCAQLATALVAYLAMFAGDAWLHSERPTLTMLVCAAPLLPMAAALG